MQYPSNIEGKIEGHIDWDRVDIVLLDMDGTLLDLRYDNHFWLEHLPKAYATARRLSLDEAMADLLPRFERNRGTLQWYCVDYWSDELGLDIAAIKPQVAHLIRWHVGAEAFLDYLQAMGKQRWLATNAHRHSFSVKDDKLRLTDRLERIVNAHDLGYPKEHPGFWSALQEQHAVDLSRAALLDDNLEALSMARQCGVAATVAISQPDTGAAAREISGEYVVTGLADLIQPQAGTPV